LKIEFVCPNAEVRRHEAFSIVLYISGVGLAILNVSEIKTPKLSGNPRNVYLLGAYTLGITAIYGLQFL